MRVLLSFLQVRKRNSFLDRMTKECDRLAAENYKKYRQKKSLQSQKRQTTEGNAQEVLIDS